MATIWKHCQGRCRTRSLALAGTWAFERICSLGLVVHRGKDVHHDVQLRFRRDTGRFVTDIPDHLDMVHVRRRVTGHNADVKLTPSKESTLRMISFCLEDVCGDREEGVLAMPGITAHPWLKYWRGLE